MYLAVDGVDPSLLLCLDLSYLRTRTRTPTHTRTYGRGRSIYESLAPPLRVSTHQ